MKCRVFIQTDEDGTFVTSVPSLPGRVSEGNRRREALTNFKDAIDGYLKSLKNMESPFLHPSKRN